MPNILSFLVSELDGGIGAVTPCIDGEPLTQMITAFEQSHGHTDPAGGYGALRSSDFSPGLLLLEAPAPAETRAPEDAYLLGCNCGETGCWPLLVSVTRVEAGYKWSAFRQPHRPQRNYAAFGPFVFEAEQYEDAIWDASERLGP